MGNTCCFFGHRTINESEELKIKLFHAIENLITNANVDTFLFGSKSQFDRFSYDVVTAIKEKYPHIRRIYVRAEFPIITEQYNAYLLSKYENTYYPEKILRSGRAAYIERNFEMIDNSNYCIVYYEELRASARSKSGTRIALDYAIKHKKEIIIFG